MEDVQFAVRVPDEVLLSAGGGLSCCHDEKGCGSWEVVVCVTGSDPALGSWDIRSCVPLQRSQDSPELWTRTIPLSADSTVQYRYALLLQPLAGKVGGEEGVVPVCVHQWECYPREVRRKGGVEDVFGERTLKSEQNETQNYRGSVDKGWLVDESELQLQFNSLTFDPSLSAPPTPYSLLVEQTPPFFQDVPPWGGTVRILDRDAGTSEEVELGERGVVWESGSGRKIVLFTSRSPSFSESEFSIKVFSAEHQEIGRACFIAKHFLSHDTHGSSSLDILSPDSSVVGKVNLSYLLVKPVSPDVGIPCLHSTEHSPATHWDYGEGTLNGGHRGMGDSYRKTPQDNPSVLENTLASLSQAGRCEADFVEFDVQLTRDLVPVLFHDFRLKGTSKLMPDDTTEMVDSDFRSCDSRSATDSNSHCDKMPDTTNTKDTSDQEDTTDSGITTSENCLGRPDSDTRDTADPDTTNTANSASKRRRPLVKDFTFEQIRSVRVKDVLAEVPMETESLSHPVEDVDTGGRSARDPFPTLKEVLEGVPEEVGFNIEVKYPVPEISNDSKSFPYFDRNLVADILLKVVFEHVGKRKIVFSSFNADMCTALRLKQPRFPVLFLTINDSPEFLENVSVDVRGQGLPDAIMHASAQRFMGINTDSYQLLDQPEKKWVETVHGRGLALFTWGSRNNSYDSVDRQRELGVDAVIYDRIDRIMAEDDKCKAKRPKIAT